MNGGRYEVEIEGELNEAKLKEIEGNVTGSNQDPFGYGAKVQYRLNQSTYLEANCSGNFGVRRDGKCGAGLNFKF